ncbi:MAG TPA: ABC transporter permease [Steroidobacteraceae bacterium]|nr:ABC transporter permease [Steroidobacteraceae bacterium]
MYLESHRTPQALELDLIGRWRAAGIPDLERELATTDLGGVRELILGTRRLAQIDLSACLSLHNFLERARDQGLTVRFDGDPPEQLGLIGQCRGAAPGPPAHPAHEEPVTALGRLVVGSWDDTLRGLAFIGRVACTAASVLGSPRRLRPAAVARHVYEAGIAAIPIVSLIAFLITVIIAYIGAQQLSHFGAELFVVDLVTIGVLRELAVLLTAIIIAGRSGSAFAAEIGSMNLNSELDALRAIGAEPFEMLVLPRILGLIIVLPLLTVIADAVGLAGGALLARYLLGIPLPQYLTRMHDAIAPTTFWVGLIKAPVFGLLIAAAGTYRGMQVHGSARELGRLTTVAVVQAIFVVLLADALFAVLFMEMDM